MSAATRLVIASVGVLLTMTGTFGANPGKKKAESEPLTLLRSSLVQRELKISVPQLAQIRRLDENEIAKRTSQQRYDARLGTAGSQYELFRPETGEEVNADFERAVLRAIRQTLKPDQYRRFCQIVWQLHGSQALAEADLQTQLLLTTEQRMRIAEHMRPAGRGTADASELDFSDVLTEQQRAQWQDLLGVPFKQLDRLRALRHSGASSGRRNETK